MNDMQKQHFKKTTFKKPKNYTELETFKLT